MWYEINSNGQTHVVGQQPPNNWGLFDMQGNIWELCTESGFETDKRKPCEREALASKDIVSYVQRGGSWTSSFMNCQAAFRNGGAVIGSDVGFRVCLNL